MKVNYQGRVSLSSFCLKNYYQLLHVPKSDVFSLCQLEFTCDIFQFTHKTKMSEIYPIGTSINIRNYTLSATIVMRFFVLRKMIHNCMKPV